MPIMTAALTARRPLFRSVLISVVAAALLLGLWLWLFPSPRFPTPTGPYRIGTHVYDLTDRRRAEPFTADRGDHRRLVVQIWYPARASGGPDAYVPHPAVTAALASRFGVPDILLANLRGAKTHAGVDAPAAEGFFPVLIFAPGYSGFRSASLFWIEELTSQGYVLIGLDQPGTSAATAWPDGNVIPMIADKSVFDRLMPLALSSSPQATPALNGVSLPGGVVPFLASDLSFIVDQLETVQHEDPILAGRLDLARLGAFGMSLGGYTAAEACAADVRFRACLVADSGHTDRVRTGLDQPVMIFSRDAAVMRQERAKAGGWPEPEIAHTIQSQRDLFTHNRAEAYSVTMNGMFHVNWTDAPIWSPIVRWMGLAGPIEPYRGFAETNAYSVAFFDRHLKGRDPALLRGKGTANARLAVRRPGASVKE